MYLRGEGLRLLGALYKPSANSKRPVFLSTGHRLTIDTCIALMGAFCKYRTCEPVRHPEPEFARAEVCTPAGLHKTRHSPS